jgi:hypothetical protein
MPRLYSPSLPGTPILGRTITVPVPFSRQGRTARLQPRLILVIVSICALLGLVLYPASPAKSVIPEKLLEKVYGQEEVDLVTESHAGSGAWGWYGQDKGRETILVTGGAGQLGTSHVYF